MALAEVQPKPSLQPPSAPAAAVAEVDSGMLRIPLRVAPSQALPILRMPPEGATAAARRNALVLP